MRSEQEVLDAVLVVELHDLADYREWWIIDDDAAALVLVPLVVSTWPERSDDVAAVYSVSFADPLEDGLVYVVRRVTVVGRLLRFELVNELLVLVSRFCECHLLRNHGSTSPLISCTLSPD